MIKAEDGAIEQYNKIIKLCEGTDYVTQDLAVELLGDEESHRREFVGFCLSMKKRNNLKRDFRVSGRIK